MRAHYRRLVGGRMPATIGLLWGSQSNLRSMMEFKVEYSSNRRSKACKDTKETRKFSKKERVSIKAAYRRITVRIEVLIINKASFSLDEEAWTKTEKNGKEIEWWTIWPLLWLNQLFSTHRCRWITQEMCRFFSVNGTTRIHPKAETLRTGSKRKNISQPSPPVSLSSDMNK